MTAMIWWRCPKCHELNPPLVQICSNGRCRAKKPTEEDPKPTPMPLPPKEPEPKKPKPVWLIKLGVWMTVLAPIIIAATWFLPPPWSNIVRIIFEALKQLIGG